MLSKVSQSEKDKFIWFYSYVELKKQQMSKGKKQEREGNQKTDYIDYREQTIENKLLVTRGKVGVEMGEIDGD